MFTIKILSYIFTIINNPKTKKAKKTATLAYFHKKILNLSDLQLSEVIKWISENWYKFTLEQKRFTNIYLGSRWKLKTESQLIRHLKRLVQLPTFSRDILTRKFQQKVQASNEFLENTKIMTPIHGEALPLNELIGVEDYLELGDRNWKQTIRIVESALRFDFKHETFLLTITAPAYLHNPQCAQDIRLAGNYIQESWERFRALMSKHGFILKGCRAVELHADFTPHIHCLINTDCPHDELLRLCQVAFLPKDSDKERGAKKHRFKLDAISKNISLEDSIRKCLRYVLKYLAKSLIFSEMDEKTKCNRMIITGCRFRCVSLFGFKKLPRFLRLAFKHSLTDINWTGTYGLNLDIIAHYTHYEYKLFNFDKLITAWCVPRWYKLEHAAELD